MLDYYENKIGAPSMKFRVKETKIIEVSLIGVTELSVRIPQLLEF
jgi:hypothetical protein